MFWYSKRILNPITILPSNLYIQTIYLVVEMNNEMVSIVVVNYNGKELLKRVLDSVYNLSYRNYKIILVDNASSDGSVDFVRKNYKKVKIVQNSKNEGYVGVNSALKFCNGKYIFFLNNDIELEKDCLMELLKAAKSTKAAMLAPKLVNFYDKSLQSGGTWVSRAFYTGHLKAVKNERIKEIPYMGLCLIDRIVTDMFGYLFDPDYFIYAEDLDLGLRLRLLGLKTLLVPSAVVYHLHAATMSKAKDYKRTFLMERNLLATFFKILSLKSILIYTPYVFGMRLVAVLKDLIALRFMNGLARIAAVLWTFANFKKISKKREALQRVRKVSDDSVLQVFSEKEMFKFKHFTV